MSAIDGVIFRMVIEMNLPGYWPNETTGVLRAAIEAYLAGGLMTPEHVAAVRIYFRQWIAAPWFPSPGIARLRATVETLTDRAAISVWIDIAIDEGIDPL